MESQPQNPEFSNYPEIMHVAGGKTSVNLCPA